MDWDKYLEKQKRKRNNESKDKKVDFLHRTTEYKILKSSKNKNNKFIQNNFHNKIIRKKINSNKEIKDLSDIYISNHSEEKKEFIHIIKKIKKKNYDLLSENKILKNKIMELDEENEDFRLRLKNNEKVFLKFENIKIFLKNQQYLIDNLKSNILEKEKNIKDLLLINKKINNLDSKTSNLEKKNKKDFNFRYKEFDFKEIDNILSNDNKKKDVFHELNNKKKSINWDTIDVNQKNQILESICQKFIKNKNDFDFNNLKEDNKFGQNEIKNFTFNPI